MPFFFIHPRRCLEVRVITAVLAAVAASAALSPPVRAAPAYEGFNYPVGTQSGGLTGGTNFLPVSGNAASTVQAGSLSDPTGTLLTSGNHLEGRSGSSVLNYQLATPGLAGNDFWVSYLMRQNAASSGWTGMVMQSGGGGLYFIGEPGGGAGDYTLVIGEAGNDLTYASSNVPFELNRDYFVVAHFQRGPGNDLATLYVNPAPGAAPPAGGVTFNGVDFVGGPPLFMLNVLALPNVTASFDELRVGATFAEVAPLVPEPGAGLAYLAALSTLSLRRRREPASRATR